MVGAAEDEVLAMRGISQILVLTAMLVASVATAAPMPTLAELEERLEGSAEMQVLQAEYDVALRRVQLDKRSHGAALYSQATFSDNDEVVDIGRTRSYRQLGGGLGLRIPVLGSRLQWQETVSRDELALARRNSERDLRRRELLRDLRIAYAEYWAAQRVAALSKEYLTAEPVVEQQLLKRTGAGLLLDSDRLELMSAFVLARRDQLRAEDEQQRAMGAMRLLVRGNLDEGTAARPGTAPFCTPAAGDLEQWLETHPELVFLRKALQLSQSSARESPVYGVTSDVRVGYHTSTEWPTQERGGSAAVTWSFEVPIDAMSHRSLAHSAVAAEHSRAQLEYERRHTQLEQQVQALLRQRASLEQSLQFARVRVASAEEAVRERELRAVRLAGDVIEKLQQARLARYNTAKALIEDELALVRWSADWAFLAPAHCRARSLYVWSSASLISQLTRDATHSAAAQARSAGFTRLLLSLDPAQLASYARDPKPLRDALDAAHRLGLHVDLLLGEPTWILEARRKDLLSIVRALGALPFDGLHLDIEPNQLTHTGIADDALLAGLLDTVRAVRAVTALPIDLSVHPRYLTQNAGARALGDELSDADVDVTLMIYVANPERVMQIAEPLLTRFPRLSQRVAVSLEDTLSHEESLHHYTPVERARRIAAVESGLKQANFLGITVQPAPSATFSTLTGSN
jgi:outer membrane protein TolC